MKRPLAILLLIVFLFNVGGYYIFFWGLRTQADLKLTQRLDADQYSEDETIELKFPVTLPYPLQNNGFERVDGRFEHDGQFYKLVKQKLENDTIYVVCIADVRGKQISDSMNDYVQKTSEIPANSKSPGFFGKLLHDFESTESTTLLSQAGWTLDISWCELNSSCTDITIPLDSPPPQS